jgi:hypothetical protein
MSILIGNGQTNSRNLDRGRNRDWSSGGYRVLAALCVTAAPPGPKDYRAALVIAACLLAAERVLATGVATPGAL